MSPSTEPPVWTPPKMTASEDVDWADILTIDLSLWDKPGGREELQKIANTALTRDGFFYVINHGLTEEELHRQFAMAQLAFDGVDRPEKEKYRAAIEEGMFRGYKLSNYWEIENGVKDNIEVYNFHLDHLEPEEEFPSALRPYMSHVKGFYARSRELVLKRVLALIDGVLQLPEGFLWSYHDENLSLVDDTLGYMSYFPMVKSDADKTNNVYLKGHTDFNTVSMLYSQPIAALQILMPDGNWKWVKHIPNSVVINLGDMFNFLSGGILKATIHRVVRPPPDQAHLRRLGLFHFAHARHGIPLAPLYEHSPRVRTEGREIFKRADGEDGKVPTTDEWETARVKTYGTVKLVKGDKYDTETVAGIDVRHYK